MPLQKGSCGCAGIKTLLSVNMRSPPFQRALQNLRHIGKQGNTSQLGGEFILGPSTCPFVLSCLSVFHFQSSNPHPDKTTYVHSHTTCRTLKTMPSCEHSSAQWVSRTPNNVWLYQAMHPPRTFPPHRALYYEARSPLSLSGFEDLGVGIYILRCAGARRSIVV